MTDPEFLENLVRYEDSALSPAEIETLERALRDDPGRRREFAAMQLRSTALHDHFRQEAYRTPERAPAPTRRPWKSRPALAAAAGLAIGLFCATVAWGMVSPRAVATAERLLTLVDVGFEGGGVAAGFPRETGVWSGDAAEVVLAEGMRAAEGRHTLRFVKAEGDVGNPEGRAIACDVFQLVDLRPLRASLGAGGDSVLELSASFLDARAADSRPSVTFFCQIFLFRGEAGSLHQGWPHCIPEAIASGSAQLTTFGGSGDGWERLTAKSLVSTEADFAVIQVSVRPNLRVPMPPLLFADAVELTLKTQPNLPVRLVHR
jgi:anti-sigma factor RsiW